MSKRFTETEIWKEDWFLEMPYEYMMLWLWVKDTCDHAGIWKPNKRLIEMITKKDINFEEAVKHFNNGRDVGEERVIVLKNGHWFLTGFIPFQYGLILNLASRMHKSVYDILDKNGVKLTSIRPQVEVKHTLKDKDTEKDRDDGLVVNDGGVQGGKTKRQFLDFVFLTAAEHEKLLQKLNGKTDEYITRLNSWAHQIGPRKFSQYKSHYHTILNWWNRDHGLTGAKTGNHVGLEGAQTLTPTQQRNCERLKKFNEKMDRMEQKPCAGINSTGQ